MKADTAIGGRLMPTVFGFASEESVSFHQALGSRRCSVSRNIVAGATRSKIRRLKTAMSGKIKPSRSPRKSVSSSWAPQRSTPTRGHGEVAERRADSHFNVHARRPRQSPGEAIGETHKFVLKFSDALSSLSDAEKIGRRGRVRGACARRFGYSAAVFAGIAGSSLALPARRKGMRRRQWSTHPTLHSSSSRPSPSISFARKIGAVAEVTNAWAFAKLTI
jgi:hypothetical protein